MRVRGEIGVGGGARFSKQAETCRLHISANGQANLAGSAASFSGKGMFVGGCPVFELRFSVRCTGQRRHHGENKNKREEDGTMHDGHPE